MSEIRECSCHGGKVYDPSTDSHYDCIICQGTGMYKVTKLLIRCPECKRENYAPNVASGVCTWCRFDINEGEEDGEDTTK